MKHKKEKRLFNFIAPIYGWFYNRQKRHYKEVIERLKTTLDITEHKSVIDFGCGTGALASVLYDYGLDVTAVDQAEKMLRVAKKKTKEQAIRFYQADIVHAPLPFEDKSFDVAITSYVAHGMDASMRSKLYKEMCRLATSWVIVHDYSDNRRWYISTVEWFEGGDYVNFIENAEDEMKAHIHELSNCFDEVNVIEVSPYANWYVCKPKKQETDE